MVTANIVVANNCLGISLLWLASLHIVLLQMKESVGTCFHWQVTTAVRMQFAGLALMEESSLAVTVEMGF